MECKFPNGFCKISAFSLATVNTAGSGTTSGGNQQQIYDISLPNGGGAVTTVVKPSLPLKKAQGAILRINLPNGGQVTEEGIIDTLKKDRVKLPDGTTYDAVAKTIVNNFSIKEDSPLSDNLIADFQKTNPKLKIKSITILKGEYPITKTKDIPNGYIDALITVQSDGHVTVLK